jgi:FixJ family two-component response regulator
MLQAPRIVCIVDDDEAVRRFLIDTLGSIGLITEEYTSGEDFMRHWRPDGVGCILLDVRMPRVTGPEVHAWLRERKHDVPVIFLSGFADVPTAVRAMRFGAFDFLEKPFNVQQLIERVNAALRSSESRAAAAGSDGEWLGKLTPRERDVLDGIVGGKRNKLIAADLGISERTVESHRANLMAKAGAQTGAELVAKTISARGSAT